MPLQPPPGGFFMPGGDRVARFYVFPTQAEAQACVDRIDARARVVYRMQGYTIDAATGDIVGKRASDGVAMPDAARTETWDVPRQRLDGKWIVAHCEAVPGATFVLKATAIPPLTVLAFVSQDIAATVTVEVAKTGWWPMPPVLKAGV